MKVLALILTLSGGAVEMRSDGLFDTHEECIEHMMQRTHNHDFRRGDVAGACVPQDKMEGVIHALFGGRA